MKIIYFTDPHGQASNPSCRLDDFPSTILGKIKYIGEYASSVKADAVVCGGDWVHTPDVSQSFIRSFMRLIRDYPCPTFGVLGNHDIFGYNPETFLRTSLGIAEGLDAFTRLKKDFSIVIEDKSVKVGLTGSDSYYDLDKKEKISDYTRSNVLDDAVNIHVVHGMLVERVWPQVAYCTTLEQVVNDNPDADIILTGHEHTGFGIKEFIRSNGKKIILCNPGSIARVTSGTGDVGKEVRIAEITINSLDDYSIKMVNLPISIAKPANEVLDWERIRKEKENQEKLKNFIQDINSVDISGNLDYYEALNQLAKSSNEDITEDIIKECLRHLGIAEEEIKAED